MLANSPALPPRRLTTSVPASCLTRLYSYMLVYIRESALPYVMVNDCEGRPPSPAGSGNAFADQCVKILRELGKHTHVVCRVIETNHC